MALTTGLVQRLTVGEVFFACVWIGPTAKNAELFSIRNEPGSPEAGFAATFVDTLATAMTNYRAVVVTHGDDDGRITALSIPAV
jgi:hypothetical protein